MRIVLLDFTIENSKEHEHVCGELKGQGRMAAKEWRRVGISDHSTPFLSRDRDMIKAKRIPRNTPQFATCQNRRAGSGPPQPWL